MVIMTTERIRKAIENEKLGSDEFPDLLVVNYSAPGNISDAYGIRSIELEDTYLRLDNEVKTLLDSLDVKVGKNNYIVFFIFIRRVILYGKTERKTSFLNQQKDKPSRRVPQNNQKQRYNPVLYQEYKQRTQRGLSE